MFLKVKMEGKYWGVFLVSMNGKERFLLTSPLETEKDADHFVKEFERICRTWSI